MSNIDIRNLRLLIIDDDLKNPPIHEFIDLLLIGNKNKCTWHKHCIDLAQEKIIEFDLLSIDMLFDKDGTDPSNMMLPQEFGDTVEL